METLSFEQQIRRLRRSVLVRTFFQAVFWLFFILLVLCALLLVVERTGISSFQQQQPPAFYGGMLAVAIAGATIISIASRKRFLERLIDIDARLKLQDVLSTAYEYQNAGKSSGFREALIEDARRNLSLLSRKQLLPLAFSWVHALFIFLLLLNVGLLVLDRFVPSSPEFAFDGSSQTERQVVQPATRPQNSKKQNQVEREEQQKLTERLQNMARQLKEKTLSPQEFSTQMNELLQEVQGSQDRLAEGSASENDSINLDDMPIRDVPMAPQSPRVVPRSLEELEEMLRNMLSQEQSEVGGAGESLSLTEEEQRQLADLLSELADELEVEETRGQGAASEEESAMGGPKNNAEQQDGGFGEQAEEQAMEDSRGDGQGEQSQEALGPIPGGRGDGSGDDEEHGDGDYRDSYAAGSGLGSDEEYAPSFPEPSSSSLVQDKPLSAPQEEYNVHIRSVTSIGKAEVPEETVVRSYRQEVESILQKEEMPVNYREFIKNYFMSIGLTQEQE